MSLIRHIACNLASQLDDLAARLYTVNELQGSDELAQLVTLLNHQSASFKDGAYDSSISEASLKVGNHPATAAAHFSCSRCVPKIAEMLAIQSKLQGMAAENVRCAYIKIPPRYDQEYFDRGAKEILSLV